MLATLISGPACVYNTPWDLRVIDESITLQIERILAFLALRYFGRRQSVGGLAGLANHQQNRFRIHERRAVAELRAIVDFGGNAGDLFEHEFADQAGMPARCRRRRDEIV